jgi:hypothetical protein
VEKVASWEYSMLQRKMTMDSSIGQSLSDSLPVTLSLYPKPSRIVGSNVVPDVHRIGVD